jgi:FkbM family methyltransferase
MPAAGSPQFAASRLPDDPDRLPDLLGRILSWLGIRTVVDVGAHVGEFAGLLRTQVGFDGRIVSFEPDPDNYEAIAEKAATDPLWHVEQLALSDAPGHLPLFRFDRSNFNSLQPPAPTLAEWFAVEPQPAQQVAVARLDDWLDGVPIRWEPPAFLKIDTQGHDWKVFEGMSRRLGDVAAVQLELSVLPLYEGGVTWTEVIRLLQDRGFWCAGLFPVTRDPGLLRVTEFDGVFTRDL